MPGQTSGFTADSPSGDAEGDSYSYSYSYSHSRTGFQISDCSFLRLTRRPADGRREVSNG